MTHSSVRPTPSWRASAAAISTWKPWRLPSLLAKGNALGCAQSAIAPLSLIMASVLAPAGTGSAIAAVTSAAATMALRRMVLTALETVDIMNDALDLIVGQRAIEGRHLAFFAVLDAVDDESVAALRAGELRPL